MEVTPGRVRWRSGPACYAPARADRMERELTAQQIRAHDEAYQKGCSLIEGEILLEGAASALPVPWLARRRLRKAIACFEEALGLAPRNWSALWLLGKIHQRLDEYPEALGCFARSHDLAPTEPDVAREAALAAIECGDGPAAVRFAKAAIAASPDDQGLVSNLAIAWLIAGDLTQARATAAEAAARAPDDPVCGTVLRVIDEVAAGRRPRPRTGRELTLSAG
jgi:tetratricopeptide (TPR) repeat protein